MIEHADMLIAHACLLTMGGAEVGHVADGAVLAQGMRIAADSVHKGLALLAAMEAGNL
jgi:hypothetical protein